jgi:hypothetical protein
MATVGEGVTMGKLLSFRSPVKAKRKGAKFTISGRSPVTGGKAFQPTRTNGAITGRRKKPRKSSGKKSWR